MPRINKHGQVVAGNGGPVSVVDAGLVTVLTDTGTCAQWLDEDAGEVIYQAYDEQGARIQSCNALSGVTRTLSDGGCNFLSAGHGRWVAWLADRGLFGHFESAEAGLNPTGTDGRGAVGEDGSFAIDPKRSGEVVLVPANADIDDQSNYRISPAPYGLYVIDRAHAVWDGGQTLSLPPPVLLPMARSIKRVVAPDDTVWWIYWAGPVGLVAHTSESQTGYVIEPEPRAFHHDARIHAVTGALLVAYSTGVKELPHETVVVDVLRECVLVDLQEITPVDPIVRIGRALWLGWFEFAMPPIAAPGNCALDVSDGVVRRNGRDIAAYFSVETEGNGPEDYVRGHHATKARHPNLPTIAVLAAVGSGRAGADVRLGRSRGVQTQNGERRPVRRSRGDGAHTLHSSRDHCAVLYEQRGEYDASRVARSDIREACADAYERRFDPRVQWTRSSNGALRSSRSPARLGRAFTGSRGAGREGGDHRGLSTS